MGKNTSISFGNHFETFIESTINEGRFNKASEVIRAGLRLLEEEENKIVALRTAIHEGIDSGFVEDFNPQKFLETLKPEINNGPNIVCQALLGKNRITKKNPDESGF